MLYEFFKKKKNLPLLKAFRCGIERETLRIDAQGNLSQKPHPLSLGSPLTHPHISTDFGEAQLEWNTPALNTFAKAENFLTAIMSFSASHLKNEYFWPFSMPCPLTDIQIARYGSSHEAQKKEIYREGLKHRYGMNLQMISSIHFNFSLSTSFWEKLYKECQSTLSLKDFISENYLHMIRNFLREGWLLTYLFGTSPAMDPTYRESLPEEFEKIGTHTLYGPWATSIRMSRLGYYSRIQNQHAISFNDLKSYIADMEYAISTPKEAYSPIPIQLNDHLLQMENEHYSRIRPKTVPRKGETPLMAIKNHGIEYVEVRAIDLDPYHPIGMSREHICFLHLFLIYCLFKPSPKLEKQAQICLTCNQDLVALNGRKKGLKLIEGDLLVDRGTKILDALKPLASLLGYENTLKRQQDKMLSPKLTPSALILEAIKEMGFLQMGVELSHLHKKALLQYKISPSRRLQFTKDVHQSLLEKTRLETASKVLVPGFETLEISTQIVIREALKRKIAVEVLDEKDNIIKLTAKGHVEYIKQATKTAKDTYIVPYLMENKHVTKMLLEEAGLRVPKGTFYTSIGDAMRDYPLYQHSKVVVKPKSTNFGLGIAFVEKGQKTLYHAAIEHAFVHGDSVIVEEYCPGKEFRFLVIAGKVVGVTHREPANITGDGKGTIKELVHAKNYDPHYYRDPKTHLRLEAHEKSILKGLRLSPTSVLKKGRKVYLRHNSNVSTGGDAIDMTDFVHPGYKEIATEATHALNAKICGVDMMLSSPESPPNTKNYAIIELNYNPVLFIHSYPYKGKERDVAGPLLDLIFSEISIS